MQVSACNARPRFLRPVSLHVGKSGEPYSGLGEGWNYRATSARVRRMDHEESDRSLSLQYGVRNNAQNRYTHYANGIHVICSSAQEVYSTDVTSWIGEQRYMTAQNNVILGFIEYFDDPDGIVVLLVALYYLTSRRDRFTYANLSDEIIEEMNDLDDGPRLSEAVRFAIVLYASAVWLARTWLLDDVAGEKRYW